MTRHSKNSEILEREAARIAKELDTPPCPVILSLFNQEFHAPRPDLRRLGALIGTDIGLAATVLKTVNPSFCGLTRKATSIEQALSILGLRACANLISGLLLRRAFPSGLGAGLERFWDASIQVANLAGKIAARLKGVNSEEAHTYVLFRDCGMLVMLHKFPQYADLMTQSAKIQGAQFTRIEDTRFGYNHARVACALGRSWYLSEPRCGAILHHHAPFQMENNAPAGDSPDRTLVEFGLLAEQIATLHVGQGLCPDWLGAESFVLDTLGIDADGVVELTEDLLEAST